MKFVSSFLLLALCTSKERLIGAFVAKSCVPPLRSTNSAAIGVLPADAPNEGDHQKQREMLFLYEVMDRGHMLRSSIEKRRNVETQEPVVEEKTTSMDFAFWKTDNHGNEGKSKA